MSVIAIIMFSSSLCVAIVTIINITIIIIILATAKHNRMIINHKPHAANITIIHIATILIATSSNLHVIIIIIVIILVKTRTSCTSPPSSP